MTEAMVDGPRFFSGEEVETALPWGALVKSLEQIIVGALEDTRWCGSDPICIESKGQGVDSCNLAACHACVLLPETSCEFQNRTLDREAVIKFFGAE